MIKLLARLYFIAPEWMCNLLPDRINNAQSGRFNDAVVEVYDEYVQKERRQ